MGPAGVPREEAAGARFGGQPRGAHRRCGPFLPLSLFSSSGNHTMAVVCPVVLESFCTFQIRWVDLGHAGRC